MTTVTTATCKVLGMEALKSSRIGAAMVWGLKSQVQLKHSKKVPSFALRLVFIRM